ncbi:MAG: membrane protein insertase YidC [Pyrinomonadaceae bacterium]
MSDNKQSTQLRFMLAAVLSLLVLFGWGYLFPSKKPANDNTNTAQTSATPTPAPASQTPQSVQTQTVAATADNTPGKTLTIKSPLYEVKIDSKGALATSWILIKNVYDHHEKLLYADGSNGATPKPLELISQKALETREIPFRLSTGDANLDAALNDRNYQISIPDETVNLNGSDAKQIDFVLNDEANNLQVVKSFVFHADSYLTDLSVKVLRGGQPVPNTKLAIGASIGDQAVIANNSYHIEPEAVAFTNNGVERHAAASMFKNKDDQQGSLAIGGDVDWAGVGDTYFAMAAIPAQKTQGLEIKTSKYEVETAPFYDGIIAWITRNSTTKVTKHLTTAYVPIIADGSVNEIYTGSKDYFTLNSYNSILTNSVGRTIDIEDFINYSNWSFLRTFIKPLSILLLRALSLIHGFVGNYGAAIIIFTLIFYSIFFPLRWYQSKSFRKAQGNAPKMKEIQDRLKELQKKGVASDDPRMREVQMEQLRLTKDALPIGGCLPLLLQMPLFFAFYTAVTISIDFRQASFLWLPDLSAADPYHVLNFLFAASMAGSMIFTPTTPTVTTEQKTQQKMMTYMMPLMMLWLMWGSPAGLLLYWFFGNIVSFVQQFFINRMNKTNAPPTEIEVKPLNKKVKLSTS